MLRIKNLTKSYNGNTIFDNFSLDVQENRITCLLGKSGIGKTTLLNVLSCITDEFSVEYSDFKDLKYSYIFQEPRLIERYSVYKNIEFVLDKKKYGYNELKEKIMHSLDMVDMAQYIDYYPSQLSGGMAQRVSIARAFVKEFDVLLMDEPFKGLDPTHKQELIERFMNMWKNNRKTVIYVTHELDEAFSLAYDIHVIGGIPAVIKYTLNKVNTMNEQQRENERKVIWEVLKSLT